MCPFSLHYYRIPGRIGKGEYSSPPAVADTAAAIFHRHPSRLCICVTSSSCPRMAAAVVPVKEHPFGVCDACRWSRTAKSRVAAHNCTAASNAKRLADQRQLGQWRFVPPMIMVTFPMQPVRARQWDARRATKGGCARARARTLSRPLVKRYIPGRTRSICSEKHVWFISRVHARSISNDYIRVPRHGF